MKCEELLAALNDYVDGERQLALCKALEAHLADCNPCQIVIDNIRQTIALYKSGEPVELPLELHDQLRQVLRDRWAAKFANNNNTGKSNPE
ncbi:MAG TPA: zf-HC2 domain-containing protein [Thermoguttaceae bacterium]